jgi:hypothetical protein
VTVRLDDKGPGFRTGDPVKIKLVGELHLFGPVHGERIDAR